MRTEIEEKQKGTKVKRGRRRGKRTRKGRECTEAENRSRWKEKRSRRAEKSREKRTRSKEKRYKQRSFFFLFFFLPSLPFSSSESNRGVAPCCDGCGSTRGGVCAALLSPPAHLLQATNTGSLTSSHRVVMKNERDSRKQHTHR